MSPRLSVRRSLLLILAFWLAIYAASLFTPPLLDDADSTHAQAARAILQTGDWVTLHVNGIRYLEKAPLPYWLVGVCMKLFGANAFAVHLPFALSVLGLALLAAHWTRRLVAPKDHDRPALYAALATLTSAGVFLFTRIFIPEALLSLLLFVALYSFHRLDTQESETPEQSRHPERSARAMDNPVMSAKSKDLPDPQPARDRATFTATTLHPPFFWTALALAVLTKGLVALVLIGIPAALYLLLTRRLHQVRRLRPVFGIALFLAIAAPWHVLASLRNPASLSSTGHGFAWFYFINEHVLRFLGRRIPRDYNKLPGYLYWTLHLIWLFPWSLFAPTALILAWRKFSSRKNPATETPTQAPGCPIERAASPGDGRGATTLGRATLLLTLYAGTVLLFFSLSTNQEYYTFPAYAPLLMLIALAIARAESRSPDTTYLLTAHIAFAAIGVAIAAALAFGLWSARGLPYVEDIGDLLAHRNVGQYTLSMSHFFDLTGPSFAALRLPASLALAAFALGPALALTLRLKRKHFAATLTIAATSAVFLVAAHIALNRFAPMLSSKDLAEKIEELADDNHIARDNDVLLFGDQAFGSSIPFYLDERVELVDGRSTSMLFGSTFRDAPPLFVTSAELASRWGRTPRRQILFVPAEERDAVDRLLPNKLLLEETSGKALFTDRPLDN